MNGTRLSVAELGELLEYVRGLKGAARARVPGLERRADTVVAGLVTLHAALSVLGAQEFTVSEGALREGMLIEELTRLEAYSSSISARQRSVLGMAERFGANLSHSRQVAALARELLSRLRALGAELGAEGEARSVLTAAGALHEVGQIVAQSAHHKHSAYLIRHAELRGFTPREIELVALLSRYHRKSAPKSSHPEFAALSAADQALVTRWVGILRVADGLDRSHAGAARVTGLTRRGEGWQLSVQGATPLDLEGAREKADVWARAFGPLTLKAE